MRVQVIGVVCLVLLLVGCSKEPEPVEEKCETIINTTCNCVNTTIAIHNTTNCSITQAKEIYVNQTNSTCSIIEDVDNDYIIGLIRRVKRCEDNNMLNWNLSECNYQVEKLNSTIKDLNETINNMREILE